MISIVLLETQFSFSYVKHANHMTMTTSGPIMSWSNYLNTKGNMNIKLPDLWEALIVYILLSTFLLVHMVLTVNKPDVRRFNAWIESADWNPCMWKVTYLYHNTWVDSMNDSFA